MDQVKTALDFILKNMAVPIAFFLVFRAQGAKPAIAVAIAVTIVHLLISRIRRIPLSPFFVVAAVFTVLFGSIDLMVRTPRFFRLEPAFQNGLIGAAFLFTLVTKIPLAEWFAKALPEQVRPSLDQDSRPYLLKVTIVWIVYFFLKAALYLYLAFHVDLGRLVILRALIGGGSLAAMFVGEILYRKLIRERRIIRP